jgi:hypothetical protein
MNNLNACNFCNFDHECFARKKGRCTLLTSVDSLRSTCNFKKPKRSVTNGVRYEYQDLARLQCQKPKAREKNT